ALIRGQVTDSTTSLPLSGVAIQISGSQNAVVSTDQSGNYSLELEPGGIEISIAHGGYHPIAGTLNAVAGTHFDFSPALQLLSNQPNPDIKLRGMVVDAQSNAPLAGVSIGIASTAISGLSSLDGSFLLSD